MCLVRGYILCNFIFFLLGIALLVCTLLTFHVADHLWIAMLIFNVLALVVAVPCGCCAVCSSCDNDNWKVECQEDIEWGASDGMEKLATMAAFGFYLLSIASSIGILVICAIALHQDHQHLYLGGVIYGGLYFALSVANTIGSCCDNDDY